MRKSAAKDETRYIHVLHELVRTADILKLGETDLGNNSAELAAGSGDTVSGRAVASGESFSGNDEGGCIGAEVLEEVGKAVKDNEPLGSGRGSSEFVITET